MSPSSNGRTSLLSRLAMRIAPLVETRLVERLISALDAHLAHKILPDLQQRMDEIVDRALQSKQGHYQRLVEESVDHAFRKQQTTSPLLGSHLYLPNDIMAGTVDGPYMTASNVLARDFLHPEFARFCKIFCHPIVTHRKLWEFAFIYHHALTAGVLRPGNRGLG